MNDRVLALEARGLGKRYGRKWALQDCSFSVPQGRVVALVGPNGAGKSTLLRMAAGLSRPSAGELTVLGRPPTDQRVDVLSRIGYLDQERPLYKSFKVSEMLRFGRELNPSWDDGAARQHLDDLSISLEARLGKLSVGQQAQVALTLCLAKRPDVLLLDEPVAALDPLARSQVMQVLLGAVAEGGTTVVMSSHVIADLEAICDYVVLLSAAHVQLADGLDDVLGRHRLLVGPRRGATELPAGLEMVHATVTDRQSTWLARAPMDLLSGAPAWPAVTAGLGTGWQVLEPTLEEIVLAYLTEEAGMRRSVPDLAEVPVR